MDFIFNTWNVDIRLDPDSEKNNLTGQILIPHSSEDGNRIASDYYNTKQVIQQYNKNIQQ